VTRPNLVADVYGPVLDVNQRQSPPVLVIPAVENERSQGGLSVDLRGRNPVDDRLDNWLDACAQFCRNLYHFIASKTRRILPLTLPEVRCRTGTATD
jgi:hypothetical protein